MAAKLIKTFRKLQNLCTRPKLKLDLFLRDSSGVIHIGANTGQERDLYERHGLNVVWVEPIPNVYAELRRNIAQLKRQKAFRYILTDRDGDDITLNIANNNGASSSIFDIGGHKEIWPEIHYTGTIDIKSTTFKTFVATENINLDTFDALVIDTQGAELLVLRGAGDLLKSFRFIKTEAADFEAYVGCCQVEDLSNYLSDFGFREVIREPFAQKERGGQYYDILYKR